MPVRSAVPPGMPQAINPDKRVVNAGKGARGRLLSLLARMLVRFRQPPLAGFFDLGRGSDGVVALSSSLPAGWRVRDPPCDEHAQSDHDPNPAEVPRGLVAEVGHRGERRGLNARSE